MKFSNFLVVLTTYLHSPAAAKVSKFFAEFAFLRSRAKLTIRAKKCDLFCQFVNKSPLKQCEFYLLKSEIRFCLDPYTCEKSPKTVLILVEKYKKSVKVCLHSS